MGIVTSYTRYQGSHSGWDAGSSGNLRSTRQTVPYVTGPYSTQRMFMESAPPGAVLFTPKPQVYSYINASDSNFGLYHEQRAVELARKRLNNTLVKGRAALGITAATANQSFAMIATRSKQILSAYTALKRGNVKRFERGIGILRNKDGTINRGSLRFTKMPLPKRTRDHFNKQVKHLDKRVNFTTKDVASTWLEYTFGWAPLVSDTYSVLEVFSDPFTVTRSHGSCTLDDRVIQHYGNHRIILDCKIRVVCTAAMKITNPNTALLTQLGLQNPLVVAWDIIPFSFVADWFFGIGSYLSKWNDMAGFEYIDPVTTVEKRAHGIFEGLRHPYTQGSVNGLGRRRTRSRGIVNKPKFPTFKLPGASLWLAVTSVSLLRQKMK